MSADAMPIANHARVGDEPCPVCKGLGELTYIDEEVGCQIGVPCWACAGPAEERLGQPASDTPWPG